MDLEICSNINYKKNKIINKSIMWQLIMGFSMGVYVGTNYDCKPTMSFISTFIKNNVPKQVIPEKKEDNN